MEAERRGGGKDTELRLTILENSLDFMLSAAEYAEQDNSRSWKYAALHLADGMELLVKARLEREHWSLLFSQVDKASKDKLAQGDFVSVDFDTACSRLEQIGGVAIAKSDRKHLDDIRRLRNQIRHHTAVVDPSRVKSLLFKCMSFCIDFCREEVMSEVIVEDIEEQLNEIHIHLSKHQEFVHERLTVIAPELEHATTWECPQCWQETLIIDAGEVTCKFCGYEVDPTVIAARHSEGELENCPECGSEATFAFILYNNDDGGWMCFSCGEGGGEYDHCSSCGNLFSSIEDDVMCRDCWSWRLSRD